ncbi:MAG: photosystem II stability/assembly factor-like uncharacterized protein, partial [Planctomycetota bacterium]
PADEETGQFDDASSTTPEERFERFEQHRAMLAASPFKEVPWQFVGPTNLSGRVTDVAVATPRGETYVIYAATATGGLWKTENDGTSWDPIFESEITAALGDVTIDPSNQETIWLGTGEQNIFRSSNAGAGVYRSTDGGATWEHRGLAGTLTIARIVVHPTDSNTVYVAASGHEWTHNEERGVYRTRDAGETWEKILYIDRETGAIDLIIDETKPKILYASTWQRIRKPWNDPRNEPDYRGSGIHRSMDGGDTWQEINVGLPEAQHRGRIGIDIARSNPSVLYAFVDNYEIEASAEEGGTDSYGREVEGTIRGSQIYRSDDRGSNWRKVSEDSPRVSRIGSTYGWVFGQIRVDPTNEDKIFVMGIGLNVSEDGGQTYSTLRGMHADHHALWIDPLNPNYLVNGNDGGMAISLDGGEKWRTSVENLPAVQFFDVAVDMAEPFRIYGSVQDHGSYRGEISFRRGRNSQRTIRPVTFERAPGWEGSDHQIDPTDPDIVYAAGFYGDISRTDLSTNDRQRIVPEAAEGEPALRGQWVAPFLISPHNPRIIYHGMNILFRSMHRGDVFEAISPDLSHNDPDKIGDIQYQTLTSIAESPLLFGAIYVGTDDGRLHRTMDSGANWTDLTSKLAQDRWVSRVIASQYSEGRVYVAQNGKRQDDFTPYLWRTDDGGESFVNIASGIPLGPVNAVAEDPKVDGLLYVGTDTAVYVSRDHGGSWEALSQDLPTNYVHDLTVHPRDDFLIAGTHGRGVWALDLIPVRDPESKDDEEEEGDDKE